MNNKTIYTPKYMSQLFLLKHLSNPLTDHHKAIQRVLYFLLFGLALHSFILINEAASNHVFADAWRHLELYLIKWNDGSFRISDLFSDHHPNAISAVLFILNGELFSLQFKYQAFIGIIFKLLLGLIITYYINSIIRKYEITWPTNAIILLASAYLLVLFYGLNVYAEYTWYLVTESHISYLSLFIFFYYCDKFIQNKHFDIKIAIFIVAAYTFLFFSSITAIKLSIATIVVALTPVIFLSQIYRKISIGLILLVLIVHFTISTFLTAAFDITPANTYVFNADKLSAIFNNIENVLYNLVSGVSIGFVSNDLINYFSNHDAGIFMATLNVAIFLLTSFSFYLFYRFKLWEVSLLPIFLAVFLIAFISAAIVFRTNISSDINLFQMWPLNIPRYYLSYHFGSMGILMIYIIFFLKNDGRFLRYVFTVFICFGIAHQFYCFKSTWRTVPYIQNNQIKAIKDMCEYQYDRSIKLHPSIARGAFSQYNYDYIVKNRLNIFSTSGPGLLCNEVENSQS